MRPRFELADYAFVLSALHTACTAEPAVGAGSRQQGAGVRVLSDKDVELAVAITNGLGDGGGRSGVPPAGLPARLPVPTADGGMAYSTQVLN